VVFVAIVGALVLAGVLVALVIVPIIRSLEILGRYTLHRILGVNPWTVPIQETMSAPETDIPSSEGEEKTAKEAV
jgi:hypothetical protein